MTTPPGTPDPQQPGGYQPPSGAYPPPSGYPAGQPAAYPPPGAPAYDPNGSVPPYDPNFAAPPAGYPVPGAVPPPAAPNKKNKWLIIAIAAVVVIGIITFVVIRQQKTATTAANVGDCIKITSATLSNPETSQAPCTEQDAIFVVTETGGSSVSCDENEPSYVEGKDTDKPSSRVCLRYNLKVGECLDLGALSTTVPKKVTCSASASTSTVKLVALLTDTTDESKCPADSQASPLTKRNLVYCFGDPTV